MSARVVLPRKLEGAGRYKWEAGIKRIEKLIFVIGMLLPS
jgi:hypothetical protein